MMMSLHVETKPYQHGKLDVGDGQSVYWEVHGNPDGKPAVVLHGGPGSGSSPWFTRLFDPAAYRTVLYDQRGCGRSTPHAGHPQVDLSTNTTQHLVADIELLRRHLQVGKWLVMGGSWGSTLALAYAQRHPDRVSEMILSGVTTGRRAETDWLFRGGVAPLFPEQWDRLRETAGFRPGDRDENVVEALSEMLHSPDEETRRRAAFEWSMWESFDLRWPVPAEPSGRFSHPKFTLAFARLVTHYVSNDLFLEDGVLLRDAGKLADIPGILVHGRLDLQAPISNAFELKRAWPKAELVVVDHAGHFTDETGMDEALVAAAERFAPAR